MEKFCRNCGSPVSDQAPFCPRCGTPMSMPSAGMDPGRPSNSGFGPAPGPAPAPTSGGHVKYEGSLTGAIAIGVVMAGLTFLPYVKLGSMSIALKDSTDVWIYFACVAVIALGELIGKPVVGLIGSAASIFYNLYEIGDARETLGIFSGALHLSWGFWLIMIFSGLSVWGYISSLWTTRNSR